jgi:hypothetical protein
MKSSRLASLVCAGWLVAVVIEGCSSDDNPGIGEGTGNDGGTVSVHDSATGATPTHFTVPPSGGSVDVATPSGTKLSFDFPPSAAGKAIVLTPTDAASIGWAASDFKDVIKMEPDGTVFADPVIVRPSSGGVMLATFPTKAEKSPPEWLALAPDGQGAELHHFSTLAVVVGCDFSAEPSAPDCAGGGTALSMACVLPQLCSSVSVSCCVGANSATHTCEFGAASLKVAISALVSGGASYCPGVDSGLADSSIDSGPAVDASPQDATTIDSGTSDSASADATGGDSSEDSGTSDSASTDSASTDSASTDSAGDDSASSDGASSNDSASSDAGSDSSSSADAGTDAPSGANGNCGTPVYSQANLGPNSCTVSRTDGTATVYMLCTASACQCYMNDTNHPFGQSFASGAIECPQAQLAEQQMIVYCGCPLN